MDNYSFVARQAILDVNGNPLGYELLFRLGLENRFPDICAEQATRRLIAEQFLSEKIDDLVGSAMCFVNFPETLLEEGYEVVANVPMHRDIAEWVADFVDAFHVERVFLKRKRDKSGPDPRKNPGARREPR